MSKYQNLTEVNRNCIKLNCAGLIVVGLWGNSCKFPREREKENHGKIKTLRSTQLLNMELTPNIRESFVKRH